jgi:hypothetical protein
MAHFDQTYTDPEFKREIKHADTEWMSKLARPEPDLNVEGMRASFFSRLLGLIRGGER